MQLRRDRRTALAPRRATPFVHASERRREFTRETLVPDDEGQSSYSPRVSCPLAALASVPTPKASWRRSNWPAILIFWRLSGASECSKWLARAKSRSTASVYGTEGQRFESSRARFPTGYLDRLSVGRTPKIKRSTSRFHGAGAAALDFLAHFLRRLAPEWRVGWALSMARRRGSRSSVRTRAHW